MPNQVQLVEESVKIKRTAKMATRGSCGMTDEDEETGRSCTDDDENEILARRYRSSITLSSSGFGDLHMLTNYRPGESKIERMAKKIQTRIEERVQVTFEARREFLKRCRKIAVSNQYERISRVKYSDILAWHDEVDKHATDIDADHLFSRCTHSIGILSLQKCLHNILTKATSVADKIGLQPDDDFHYEDFNHHHTMLVSRWPWMRNELLFAAALVLTFYFFTPICFVSLWTTKAFVPKRIPRCPAGSVPCILHQQPCRQSVTVT